MNTENNKIIAEFMGVSKSKIDANGQVLNFENSKYNTYNSDWNWLMEAIEKCLIGEAEHDDEKAKKAISEIYESLCSINISATYKSVVEFIKWYNEQK